MNEDQRIKALEDARPRNSVKWPWPKGFTWDWSELNRLRLAFAVIHDEPLPTDETLMAVASEGVRIFLEEKKRRGQYNG